MELRLSGSTTGRALTAWFRAVQQRKGMKIARVALDRRLAEIVYQIWKEDMDFVTLVRGGVRR